MRFDDQAVREVLEHDGLAAAERITGKSYKDDPDTQLLGMALHMRQVDAKQTILASRGDTTFSMKLSAYLDVIRGIGFEQVLCLPFLSRFVWNNGTVDEHNEEYHIWWEPRRGILLSFDTYRSKSVVNGGKFYYNWKPARLFEDDGTWVYHGRVTSSGGYSLVTRTETGFKLVDRDEYWRQFQMTPERHAEGFDYIWAGDHDCREAVRFHIEQLESHGEFVVPWVKQPFLWLLHHMDTKDGERRDLRERGYDYKKITADRIAMFPEQVRMCLGATP